MKLNMLILNDKELEFLDRKKTRVNTGSGRAGSGPSVDSRWHTFENGKRNVKNIGSLLRVPKTVVESACHTYQLCLQNNFTRGRRIARVAAVCLYIACRLNGHPVLLIDFVPHISHPTTPVMLGRICLRLTNLLSLRLPAILGGSHSINRLDPSVFLYRFAAKMDFGDKLSVVVMTSVRVLNRMQSDWLHWGRHPAGLFGAALLIAARLHGFKRTRREVSRVVYIGQETVGRRVCDFTRTPAAQLSLQDFDKESVLGEIPSCNPPAFERGRLKWDNPDEIIRWPEKIPKRVAEIERWISEGMTPVGSKKEKNVQNSSKEEVAKEVAKDDIDDSDEDCNLEEFDDQIECYLVDDDQQKLNCQIWEAVNSEYLKEQAEKAEQKKEEDEAKAEETLRKQRKPRNVTRTRKRKGPSAALQLVMDESEESNSVTQIAVDGTVLDEDIRSGEIDEKNSVRSEDDDCLGLDLDVLSDEENIDTSNQKISTPKKRRKTSVNFSMTKNVQESITKPCKVLDEDLSLSVSLSDEDDDLCVLSDDELMDDCEEKSGAECLAKTMEISYDSGDSFFDEFD
uniref:BRF1-domain-containing protein n=1 Tax=Hirondellea gigas TaxID=1518452 RepID=A0A6A7G7V5_9CRUS